MLLQSKNTPRLAGAPHKKAFIKAPMNLLGAKVIRAKFTLKKIVTDSLFIESVRC